MEVFSSFQGEGTYAGVRQIFVRLGGCNLRCRYCDTPDSWTGKKNWRYEWPPESRTFVVQDNPTSPDTVLDLIARYQRQRSHHSVSFTGGEPVLQPDFLRELMRRTHGLGLRTYLETNGTLHDRLSQVIDEADIVALDIKLPSCPGITIDPEDVRRCVEVSASRELLVKIILTRESRDDEIEWAASLVRRHAPRAPVILQPATPVNLETQPSGGDAIARFREICRRQELTSFVIPQLHPILGWL